MSPWEKIIIKRPGPGVMLTLARKAYLTQLPNQIYCNYYIFLGCAQLTLIRLAQISTKTVFMAKLLQYNSNLNHRPGKLKKGQRNFEGQKKRAEVEKHKCSHFFKTFKD